MRSGESELSTIRVLVVEYQQLIREGIRALLENAPQLTVAGEARDGEEAIRLAAELVPDIVLMDVCMPGIDGIQATKAIKAVSPSLPILGLSGNDDERYVFQMLDAGANGYLLKSTTAAELIRAIGIVHTGGTMLAPSIAGMVVNRLKSKQLSNYGDRFEGLSHREIDVLQIAANGKSSKQIGQVMYISPHTVQAHMRNIYTKLEVGSRAEAVAYALRQGWITLDGQH
jgi:DNA-binding NarL/FixJ family response regulator